MRAAGLYLRISKDMTGEGLAVERQRADGLRLIEQRGWTLHEEYVDNDVSAAGRKKRPGFEKLLHDVEAGAVTVIVSLALDRLTRNRRDQLRLIETCQQHSILVALVRGSDVDMTTAVGRAMADMMSVWARMEIEQKSERHISQIAQAARAGKMVGGRRAFGYTTDGMTVHPVEAPIVRDLYDQWLDGVDLSSLARALNAAGHLTPRGNRWNRGSVREVLANPRNAGLRGMRDVVNRRTGTRSKWHRIIGPAVWPAIVPEDTWRAAMARIQDPARDGNHRGIYPSRHLLPKIAHCGVCGDLLVAGRRDGKRTICCATGHLARNAQWIEDHVEQAVIERFTTPQGRHLLAGPQSDDKLDVRIARSRAVDLRAKLDGLAADYVDGVLDRDQVRVGGERARAELAELEARMASAGRRDLTARLLAVDDVEEEWDQRMTIGMRRELIRQIMRITVLRGLPGRPGGQRFDPATVLVEWVGDET